MGFSVRPLAIPKRIHAPEMGAPEAGHRGAAELVRSKVSGIIAGPDGHASVQRFALSPDESVTYVRDARRSVVGRFETVMASRDGTAWARDGKYWVIISPDGGQQTVVDLGENASPEVFWDGMARFSRDGKFGFITDAGEVVADAKFDDARRFDGAYARVKVGGMWGAVDRAGREAVACAHIDEDAVGVVLDRHVRRAA